MNQPLASLKAIQFERNTLLAILRRLLRILGKEEPYGRY